jgi:hypothetical protein
MKKLKIASFVLTSLYFALHFVYEFYRQLLGPYYELATTDNLNQIHKDFLTTMHIIDGYKTLCMYIMIPIILVYMYKRLK